MKGFPDLPPIWFLAFWAVYRLWAWFDPSRVPDAVARPVSYLAIGTGLLIVAWSAIWFFRKKTTIEPHHDATTLIVEGPYRLSRNPIYLALVIILAGAILGGGPPLALGIIPVFMWVLHRRFVLPEEEGLRRSFGRESETYFQKTRRWI